MAGVHHGLSLLALSFYGWKPGAHRDFLPERETLTDTAGVAWPASERGDAELGAAAPGGGWWGGARSTAGGEVVRWPAAPGDSPWGEPGACVSHLPLPAQARPLHPQLLCEMSCPGPQETGGTCRWQWGRPRGLPKLPSQAPTVGEARHLNPAQRPRGSMSRELVLRPARTCA